MHSYFTITCLVAVAAHSTLGYGGPALDHYSFPKYTFNYGVSDPHTGDKKSQWESRFGDSVKGSYSLVEPNGKTRVVDYTADDNNGFNAVVKHIGHELHPSPIVPHLAPMPEPQSFPHYAFNYAVNDPHTGDKKSQWESRFGDSVKGSYSLLEPNGKTRVVDYTADDHNGFNAVVKHIGPELHPSPIVAPIPEPIHPVPINPFIPGAVSTANMIQFSGPSYPVISTSFPLPKPVWGLQPVHPAELPLQAGPGGIPWSFQSPKVKEEKPEIAPAPMPVYTVKNLWRSRDGKRTWSSGPIPFVDGNKVIFRHHY